MASIPKWPAKILVVEDSTLDFELMKGALAAAFACDIELVMKKADYESALDKEAPDVIVSDSNVVLFEGAEALEIAKAKCPATPFIFCTGSPAPDRQQHALEQGAYWVQKEPGFEALVSQIARLRETQE